MRILGIESSCDDTAVAVVDERRRVLADVATNQDAFHARFGGIVPEIASRRHVALMTAAVDDALARAGLGLDDLDGVAVTCGPGLIGSLVVGVATAKALAYARDLPLYGVHHLHGHLFSPFLDVDVAPRYPLLGVIVSGGHTQLVRAEGPCALRVLGRTIDDAAGEAFDKTARLLGLPFPGGPHLDRLSRGGDPKAVPLPRHRAAPGSLDMSFSGLKTAARRAIEAGGERLDRADLAASFQAAVVDERVERALAGGDFAMVALGGGVAANRALQAALRRLGERTRVPVVLPAPAYCGDNGAMIAAAAVHQGRALLADPLTLVADPRLPFEGLAPAT